MNLSSLVWLVGLLEAVGSPASESESNQGMEKVALSLERMVMKLDRLVYRLLHGRAGTNGGPSTDSRREFGIPTKSPQEWKKLADRIKHKERRRDMKHWKSHKPQPTELAGTFVILD
jgi:hypothetical protein